MTEFSSEGWDIFWKKRIDAIWRLLPMYENGEDWEKDIPIIVLSLRGAVKVLGNDPQSRVILVCSLLLSLLDNRDYNIHREIVFESVSLVEGVRNYGLQGNVRK